MDENDDDDDDDDDDGLVNGDNRDRMDLVEE